MKIRNCNWGCNGRNAMQPNLASACWALFSFNSFISELIAFSSAFLAYKWNKRHKKLDFVTSLNPMLQINTCFLMLFLSFSCPLNSLVRLFSRLLAAASEILSWRKFGLYFKCYLKYLATYGAASHSRFCFLSYRVGFAAFFLLPEKFFVAILQ